MGEMVWRELAPELKKRRVSFSAHMTEHRRHAEQIAADLTSDGEEHTLVVLGGDGTVNEVVNGILDPELVTLGYIPIGSSNDFARGLGIPKDPKKAMETILAGAGVQYIDIGILTRAGRTRKFAVSAGIGFDAAVCHEVCVSRWKILLNRLGLGKLSYAVVALHRLTCDKPVKMTVEVPDRKTLTFQKTYFAAFMNLQYEGGGFRFCPHARPGDGLLDVIVVHDLPKWKLLALLPTAFPGKHTGFRGITILHCPEVHVKTQRVLPLHTDGEPGFPRKEITAGVLGKKLKVITGEPGCRGRQ